MRIGIIGAGFIGCAVARLAVPHGHEVMISNSRGPESLAGLAADIGCQAGRPEDAAAFGEVVLVAIPFRNYQAIPAAPLRGKVVIDANNYYPDRDGRVAELDARTTTTSQMLAQHLPGSSVVKTFNAILAKDLETDGRPAGSADRRALPIAGDDRGAKALVAGLLDQFGFDPLDAGPLCESWRFERAKPAYCIPLDLEGLTRALAAARRNEDLPHGSWRH